MADVLKNSGSLASAKDYRLVRCPRCLNVLPEPPNILVYRCSGCGTRLRDRSFRILENKLIDPCVVPMCLPINFLKTITQNFSKEQELGRGGHGVVCKGVLRNGKAIAVKKLSKMHLEDTQFHNEVIHLIGLKHKNIVQLVGYCAESRWKATQESGKYVMAEIRKRLLCFEYVNNKSLDKHLSAESCGLEWRLRYDIIRGICSGLHYLHTECHIIHLDLKPENVLLDDNMVPKIKDFVMSRLFCQQQSRAMTENRGGTLGYMAPEYSTNGLISTKSDIFSFGVIIIVLMTGSRDYPQSGAFGQFIENVAANWRNRLEKIHMYIPLEVYSQQVNTCINIGLKCVDPDPMKRPSALDIIQMLDETECTNRLTSELQINMLSNICTATSGKPQMPDKYVLYMTDLLNNSDSLASAKAALPHRHVRCPRCHSVLEEPPNVLVYQCGGCGTCLRSRPFRILEKKLKDPCAVPMCLPINFLKSITQNFSKEQELGRGAHGVVYKGNCANGKEIAVKKLFSMDIHEDDRFQKEVTYLLKLKHQNIVQFVGYCDGSQSVPAQIRDKYVMAEEQQRLLCFEYLNNMSLRGHISDASCGLEWNVRHELIRGICCGLHYLHTECHIVHLDLKPMNILMDDCMVPKIADFGISKLFGDQQSRIITATIRGTLGYMAPEYINNGLISYKVNIFSLGVIIIELMTGCRDYPYPYSSISESNSVGFVENVVGNWRKRFETEETEITLLEKYSEQVMTCIMIGLICVNPDPKKRPAIGDVMNILDAEGDATSCFDVNGWPPQADEISPFRSQVHLPTVGSTADACINACCVVAAILIARGIVAAALK